MRGFWLFLLGLFFVVGVQGQRRYILYDVETGEKRVRGDSVQAARFLDSLVSSHYWGTEVLGVNQGEKDLEIRYRKGARFGKVILSWGAGLEGVSGPRYTNNLDSVLASIQKRYDDLGYVFHQVRTRYLGRDSGYPMVRIEVEAGRGRSIDGLHYLGGVVLPGRYRQDLERRYVGRVYNPRGVLGLERELSRHPWLMQTQAPQTLFRPDSTLVILHLKKKSRSNLDVLLGFGNDADQGFRLNGHLRVDFRNLLNRFEGFSVHWERTQDRAQNFDMSIDYPYLYRDIGVGIQTEIFRQDSAFARMNFQGGLYYQYGLHHRLGADYSFEQSASLQPQTYREAYTKSGFGLSWIWEVPSAEEMFVTDQSIRLEAKYLEVRYGPRTEPQQRVHLEARRIQGVSGNHYVQLSGVYHRMSQATNPSESEFYRLGGWRSLRGFNERSIPAQNFWGLGAEYRYLLPSRAFFSTFTDWAGVYNPYMGQSNLYSFGLGMHFAARLGIVSVQLASGQTWGQAIRWNETKIHIGFLGRF